MGRGLWSSSRGLPVSTAGTRGGDRASRRLLFGLVGRGLGGTSQRLVWVILNGNDKSPRSQHFIEHGSEKGRSRKPDENSTEARNEFPGQGSAVTGGGGGGRWIWGLVDVSR